MFRFEDLSLLDDQPEVVSDASLEEGRGATTQELALV